MFKTKESIFKTNKYSRLLSSHCVRHGSGSCLSLSAGHSLTQFVRHCADHFLNSEHKEIRMEAARTCSRLLTPSIHLISGHGHVVSQTAVQVVADVLSKLLVVGITDPGEARRDGAGGRRPDGQTAGIIHTPADAWRCHHVKCCISRTASP